MTPDVRPGDRTNLQFQESGAPMDFIGADTGPQLINRYAYVGNDPPNFRDPDAAAILGFEYYYAQGRGLCTGSEPGGVPGMCGGRSCGGRNIDGQGDAARSTLHPPTSNLQLPASRTLHRTQALPAPTPCAKVFA